MLSAHALLCFVASRAGCISRSCRSRALLAAMPINLLQFQKSQRVAMNKILLLEDESMLCEMIADYLQDSGYKVDACASYDEAIDLATQNYDVFVFDVKIIGGNGFNLLSELRESGINTPCIFITSLNFINYLKVGFRAGFDDYLKKLFELAELALRIQNLLKRNYGRKSEIKIDEHFSYDVLQKQLLRDKERISLPNKQNELLALFISRPNEIITRAEIYSYLWGLEEPSEMSLRVYIRDLRKLLGEERIISYSKQGYEFKNDK